VIVLSDFILSSACVITMITVVYVSAFVLEFTLCSLGLVANVTHNVHILPATD